MPDVTRLFAQARAQVDAGQLVGARATLMRAVQADANFAPACDLLAFVLSSQGQHAQALHYAQRAAKLSPDNAGVQADCASILLALRRFPEAIEQARRAVQADARSERAHGVLIAALLSAERIADARDAALQGLAHLPGHPDLTLKLAACELDLAMPDAALARLHTLRRSGAATDPRILEYQATLCNYASAHAEGDGPNAPGAIASAHRAVGQWLLGLAGPRSAPAAPTPVHGRPLRVGVLSGDLRKHSVSRFIEPVLRHADPARVQFHAFSTARAEDDVSARLRALCASWTGAGALDPGALGAALRRANLDCILELGGLMGVPGLLALRDHPAPISISYLGYPNTTGCTFIDHRLVDAITDPPALDHLATEHLARLPGCFLCYQPPADLPPPRPRPDGPPVLACFTVIQKLSLSTLRLWGAVLREISDATLLLKSETFNDERTRDHIMRHLHEQGVPIQRVRPVPYDQNFAAHLDRYHDAHLALDPTPYNGTTSTCDALATGTPVLAMLGPVHAARVSASILTHAGLPQLVTPDEGAYVRRAADLFSGDRAELRELHATLRARFLSGPICDGPAFCRGLEATLLQLCAAHARA
jgi:protein O-GlcNAc transferase